MHKLKILCLVLSFLLFAVLPFSINFSAFAKIHKIKPTPPANPERIVSMSPGHTEILFALGAGEKIVGVSSFSDDPDEAKTKPVIGGDLAPDLEKVLSLKPDIVFALSHSQARYISILEQSGIYVVALEPQTMQEILSAIDSISRSVGKKEQGEQLMAKLTHSLNNVRRIVQNSAPKRVFVEVWDMPLLTVGGKSFISDIVKEAGGINVAENKNLAYAPCDIETLYLYNPEVYIVVSHEYKTTSSIITKPEFKDIDAVKHNRILPIPADLIVRSGPRSFDGLWEMAKIIHPEKF
jgi:iron complex transport system substrate-binding protein